MLSLCSRPCHPSASLNIDMNKLSCGFENIKNRGRFADFILRDSTQSKRCKRHLPLGGGDFARILKVAPDIALRLVQVAFMVQRSFVPFDDCTACITLSAKRARCKVIGLSVCFDSRKVCAVVPNSDRTELRQTIGSKPQPRAGMDPLY